MELTGSLHVLLDFWEGTGAAFTQALLWLHTDTASDTAEANAAVPCKADAVRATVSPQPTHATGLTLGCRAQTSSDHAYHTCICTA